MYFFEAREMLTIADDFRIMKYLESIPDPELVYQKTQEYLQMII